MWRSHRPRDYIPEKGQKFKKNICLSVFIPWLKSQFLIPKKVQKTRLADSTPYKSSRKTLYRGLPVS
jgi:hypothetical protein